MENTNAPVGAGSVMEIGILSPSNIEFYKTGLVDTPIPSTSHIDEFLEEDINGL